MRALAISAIVLVAVIMGFSTIAPALQQAFAHDVTEPRGRQGIGGCPEDFQLVTITKGLHPDHNFNGFVCFNLVNPCDPRSNTFDIPVILETRFGTITDAPCLGTPILIDDSAPPRL